MISESSVFRNTVFDALCACLNLNRNSAEAIALIQGTQGRSFLSRSYLIVFFVSRRTALLS